jgi:chloramphenicol O-acetyltransferase
MKEKKTQIKFFKNYIYISTHCIKQLQTLTWKCQPEKKRKIPHFTEEQYLLIILKVSVRKERIL